MLELKWTADLKTESDCDRMAVGYEIINIPLKAIDWKESQVNGARIGAPLVRELIDDYKTGHRNGDVFPRPTVARSPLKGYYKVLSGNQRTTSVKELVEEKEVANDVQIPCYLVDTDDKLLQEIIARSANVTHGGRCSKDERLAHAIYCVRTLGMQTAQAARLFMVHDSTINMHVRAEEERKVLAKEGLDTTSIPNVTIDALRRIPDRAAKVDLCHVVGTHCPPADRVKAVVASICRCTSPQARLKKVKEFSTELRKQVQAAGPRRNGHMRDKVPLRPQRDKLLSMLDRLNAFLEHGPNGEPYDRIDALQFSGGDDTARAVALWDSIQRRMQIIMRGVKCQKTRK